MDFRDTKGQIVELAAATGFHAVGVAAAAASARGEMFLQFIQQGYHADMAWLARDPAARCDVRTVLPGAASVICLAVSYVPAIMAAAKDAAAMPPDAPPDAVARYARGRDYHRLLKNRCRKIVAQLEKLVPGVRTKICVDIQPVSDRDLAASAGLGWIGRNGCLIHQQLGSYLLLAEIVTDLPLPPDGPIESRCGHCRRCVRACPTGAITAEGLVDCRRCISYLTIEHRGEIPAEFHAAIGGRIFGCDACQEACPFNQSAPAGDPLLIGPNGLANLSTGQILEWSATDWDKFTRGTAARRATCEMFRRNAAIAARNRELGNRRW